MELLDSDGRTKTKKKYSGDQSRETNVEYLGEKGDSKVGTYRKPTPERMAKQK